MNRTLHNRSGTVLEMIATLTAISRMVSKNGEDLRIIAAHRQSEEGGTVNVKNERYGYDHRRTENVATAINDTANWLAQQFGGTPETAGKQKSLLLLPKPALSLEEVQPRRLINLVPDIQLKFENFLKSTVQASCHS